MLTMRRMRHRGWCEGREQLRRVTVRGRTVPTSPSHGGGWLTVVLHSSLPSHDCSGRGSEREMHLARESAGATIPHGDLTNAADEALLALEARDQVPCPNTQQLQQSSSPSATATAGLVKDFICALLDEADVQMAPSTRYARSRVHAASSPVLAPTTHPPRTSDLAYTLHPASGRLAVAPVLAVRWLEMPLAILRYRVCLHSLLDSRPLSTLMTRSRQRPRAAAANGSGARPSIVLDGRGVGCPSGASPTWLVDTLPRTPFAPLRASPSVAKQAYVCHAEDAPTPTTHSHHGRWHTGVATVAISRDERGATASLLGHSKTQTTTASTRARPPLGCRAAGLAGLDGWRSPTVAMHDSCMPFV